MCYVNIFQPSLAGLKQLHKNFQPTAKRASPVAKAWTPAKRPDPASQPEACNRKDCRVHTDCRVSGLAW